MADKYLRENIKHCTHCINKYTHFRIGASENHLSEEQLQAANGLLNSSGNISMLIGGPGTGKSFVIETIVSEISRQRPDDKIALITPTGKATRHLRKLLHGKTFNGVVKTIKKFLGFNMSGEVNPYVHTITKNYSVIIIDECSMLDYDLLQTLLDSVDHATTKIIFVGDKDQLEAIGRGSLIEDFIDMGIPTFELTTNYRSNRTIQKNAEAINNGITNLEENNSFQIFEAPYETIMDRLGYYNKDSIVLSPYRKEPCKGNATEINRRIQENRFGAESPLNNRFFCGDEVILLKNNYKQSYFNGDTGIVKDFRESDNIYVVELDNGNTVYVEDKENDEDKELDLAYALTVHKSQGSEYKEVDIVITKYSDFITRKMLYTAVTRAKEKVRIWVTDKSILSKIIENEPKRRRSFLLDEPMPELEDDYDIAL